jgi:hypothetical protein
MNPTIKNILGNRIIIRRLPTQPDSQIVIVPGPDDRESHFQAVVLAVGWKLSEPIHVGDTVLCAAHRSQPRVGTRHVNFQGQPAELMSTLDVVAVFRVQARTSGYLAARTLRVSDRLAARYSSNVEPSEVADGRRSD